MTADLALVSDLLRDHSTDRAYKNGPERLFSQFAVNHGWFITKKGWPDFLCLSKNGEFFVVECKPNNRHLKAEQTVCAELLEARGIRVFVSDGTRLVRYRRALHARIKGDRRPR